jgi:hypothetical protein
MIRLFKAETEPVCIFYVQFNLLHDCYISCGLYLAVHPSKWRQDKILICHKIKSKRLSLKIFSYFLNMYTYVLSMFVWTRRSEDMDEYVNFYDSMLWSMLRNNLCEWVSEGVMHRKQSTSHQNPITKSRLIRIRCS